MYKLVTSLALLLACGTQAHANDIFETEAYGGRTLTSYARPYQNATPAKQTKEEREKETRASVEVNLSMAALILLRQMRKAN